MAKKQDVTATDLGRVAYDAFSAKLQKLENRTLPFWADVPAQIQMAWVGAGLAIWKHMKRSHV